MYFIKILKINFHSTLIFLSSIILTHTGEISTGTEKSYFSIKDLSNLFTYITDILISTNKLELF